MFSGIVEETAKLVRIEKEQSNIHFYFTCSFGDQLRIDQSVAHNGVCLTVVEIDKPTKTYKVTAMKETLYRKRWQLVLHLRVRQVEGKHYGRKGFRIGKRCEPHGCKLQGKYIFRIDNTIYISGYKFPLLQGRHYRKP